MGLGVVSCQLSVVRFQLSVVRGGMERVAVGVAGGSPAQRQRRLLRWMGH